MTSILPKDSHANALSGAVLAYCIGDHLHETLLNKMMAGERPIGVADQAYRLAAALEYAVTQGTGNKLNREGMEEHFTGDGKKLTLWPEPICGSFGDFCQALLILLRRRPDFSAQGGEPYFTQLLADTIHTALQDAIDASGCTVDQLGILHGTTNDWSMHKDGQTRIIRQPAYEIPNIPEGNFIQLAIPATEADQCLFGFEMRTNREVVTAKWPDVGSWFHPRHQPKNELLALLDEYAKPELNPYVDTVGAFRILIIAVPWTGIAAVPGDLAAFADGAPQHWQREHGNISYAHMLACIRFLLRAKRQGTRCRLYEGRYNVVPK